MENKGCSPTLFALLALASLAGCDERSQRSLVGDFDAPDPTVLEDDEIELAGASKYAGSAAQARGVAQIDYYTIMPGGLVKFKRRLTDWGGIGGGSIDTYTGSHEFKLERADYLAIRSKLAQLRPQNFFKSWTVAYPNGCGIILDTASEASVVFARSDKSYAVVRLDHACTSPDAGQIREILDSVFALLDQAKI